ncbi:Trafficking protein particle complex subunit 2-like protein [Quillaja saponaria]|uniref:Trafficking protein particle complex subunit 2-like protein n=1 Tax=Quillaja saponaria TaxID=32244 RepID=A0AAD7Q449_QUISA|nr:Trafficking protein particle complex subunit 2-like protein [Quillaja saponaria]
MVGKDTVNNPKKSGPLLNEAFLGLLYPTENYKVYGYLRNTKVKFILVTTDLDVRDADARNLWRRMMLETISPVYAVSLGFELLLKIVSKVHVGASSIGGNCEVDLEQDVENNQEHIDDYDEDN